MNKGFILVDPKRCLSCHTCQLQCALEHSRSKDLEQAIQERPLAQSRIKVVSAVEVAVPLQCRHCEDAPCVEVCPSKATSRENIEQPVLIKQELCIGCRWCILVCPFGVIKIDSQDKAVIKCELCFARLQEGKQPACVEGCPSGALQFKTKKASATGKDKEYLVKFKRGKEII